MNETERVDAHKEMNEAFATLLALCMKHDLSDMLHGNLTQSRHMMGTIIDYKRRKDA